MLIEEILIIKNGEERYGVSTADISQIARAPMLMPLPLRPSGVRGLCAVSGNIITMIDMNLLLGLEEVKYEDEKARIIILNDALASSTLLVSEVYNTVEVKAKDLEYIDKKDDPIVAIYKYDNSLIQVLSLDILFSKISKVEIEAKEIKNGNITQKEQKEKKEENTNRFLIFAMENERYALKIEYLREIILADLELTDLAGTKDEVLGLITLRDELVIVIDLRKHYGFKTKDSYKNRILIASHEGKKIGLLIDEVIDIKAFVDKDIEYMKESFEDNKIAGVIHDDGAILSFFDKDVLENLFEENNAFLEEEHQKKRELDLEENIMEVIVFKLGAKEYAFEVEKVSEIIDIVDSTQIAYTEDSIDGIINIRGQIIAIVSLFTKLNIPNSVHENSKIIICEIDGVKIGFTVDNVSDILNIKETQVREQEDELFSKVLHLDNGERLVLSMDIDEIVSSKGI